MGKVVEAVVGVAIVVVAAVVAPYLVPAFLTTLVGASAALAITTAVVGIALSLAASVAFRALGIGSVGIPSAKVTGVPQVFRQAITDAFIVYGKRRVGGLLNFFHAKLGDDGFHYRYFVIACAGHQCLGVVSWKLNDEDVTVDGAGMVTSGKYANAAWVGFYRGTPTDAAAAVFVAECDGKWTSAHQGKGIAKIYAKFKLTDDVVQAGMPNITAIIEGRDEIRDARTGTTGYTRNGPLIFYDWMATAREEGGFGAYSDEVPDDAWISAQANVADETVNGNARYALDAVLTTGSPPGQVRDALVVNMAGKYTYSGGKHLMRPGYWVPVSVTLEEEDLAGPIQVSPFLPAELAANQVQGTYISPSDGYQGMPFTTQSSGAIDIKQMDLDLAFTAVLDQANRVATIMLRRAEAEKTVVWPMNCVGIGVSSLDTAQANSARYGLSNYAWWVAGWGLSSDYGVVLKLAEENAAIYDDPAPVTPPSPPPISPGTPVPTLADIQTALINTYPVGLTLTAVDAGSDATIQFSAFTLEYPGKSVSIAAHNLTGQAYSTNYFPYLDVTGPGDDAPTFGAALDHFDSLNSSAHPYRVHLFQQIATPAAGGASTGGTSTGGGGIQGEPGVCLVESAPLLMAKRAWWWLWLRRVAGATVRNGDARVGEWVWTRHHLTGKWMAARVVAQRRRRARVYRVPGLPLATKGHLCSLGERIAWEQPYKRGEFAGWAWVVDRTVAEAHSYFTPGGGDVRPEGVLNHNVSPIS